MRKTIQEVFSHSILYFLFFLSQFDVLPNHVYAYKKPFEIKDSQLPPTLPTCYLSLPTQPNFLIRLFTLTISTSLPPTHSLANFNLSSFPDTPLNHSHQGHRILWTLSSFNLIWLLGNSLCVWSLPRCIIASLDFWDTTSSWSSSGLGSLLFLLHPFSLGHTVHANGFCYPLYGVQSQVYLWFMCLFLSLDDLHLLPPCPPYLASSHFGGLSVQPQWSQHVSAFSDTFIFST